MKPITNPKITFDPEADPTIKKIFDNRASAVLWCCIKSGHITDQYFDDKILKMAEKLQEKLPTKYQKFLKVVRPLTEHFGKVYSASHGMYSSHETVIDNEFWMGIYDMICHHQHFKPVFID